MSDFTKIDSETGEETSKRRITKAELLKERKGCVAEIARTQKEIDEIDSRLTILK